MGGGEEKEDTVQLLATRLIKAVTNADATMSDMFSLIKINRLSYSFDCSFRSCKNMGHRLDKLRLRVF